MPKDALTLVNCVFIHVVGSTVVSMTDVHRNLRTTTTTTNYRYKVKKKS